MIRLLATLAFSWALVIGAYWGVVHWLRWLVAQ